MKAGVRKEPVEIRREGAEPEQNSGKVYEDPGAQVGGRERGREGGGMERGREGRN